VVGLKTDDRRSSGLLRVPFVQVCRLRFADGRSVSGFMVNINVLGAYIAAESKEFPALGESLTALFRTPDNETEMAIAGSIAWVNAHQPHPVHSLPPGFGIRFQNLSDEHTKRIQRVVGEYLDRHPQSR
jgi:Tfp pilus assembly protein PilZ